MVFVRQYVVFANSCDWSSPFSTTGTCLVSCIDIELKIHSTSFGVHD